MTWNRRLYSPSEGRRAEDFFALKIRWLQPGTKGQHAISRPPKPLKMGFTVPNFDKIFEISCRADGEFRLS
jgi:hypothetical protein